jgi:hypothetical protein
MLLRVLQELVGPTQDHDDGRSTGTARARKAERPRRGNSAAAGRGSSPRAAPSKSLRPRRGPSSHECDTASRARCLGACLLPRLSEPPKGLRRGGHRQPAELGVCGAESRAKERPTETRATPAAGTPDHSMISFACCRGSQRRATADHPPVSVSGSVEDRARCLWCVLRDLDRRGRSPGDRRARGGRC